MVPENIGLAGAGRVALALGRLLRERGEPVVSVASRSIERAQAAAASLGGGVAAVRYTELPRHATRLIFAVPDRALADVAGEVAGGGRVDVALHTAGACGPEALAALKLRGASCGLLHPLQTIAQADDGAQALRGAAFSIWGDEEAVAWAQRIASLAGGAVLRIPPPARAAYHAAAVLASNYITALIDAAVLVLESAGIGERDALSALGPLLRTSVQNTVRDGAAAALTGPIERGDSGTVRAHLEALAAAAPEILELYRAAGRHTLDIARRRGLPAPAAAEIEQALKQ